MSRYNIGRVLKRLRNQKGYSVDKVGELVGRSGKTVSAWECGRGQPDAEMLMTLCDIYEVEDILKEFKENIENETQKIAPAADNSDERTELIENINTIIQGMNDSEFEHFYRVFQVLIEKPTE